MKEVKKCSISGIAFTLDDDAYTLLEEYLQSLRTAYADTLDGDEIVADIEARIAELILSRQENTRVVEAPLLREILSQMGTAETISSESESDADGLHHEPRIPRRLYRDTDNARLGGVCAGLGRYFDIDTAWVRLSFFAPLLMLVLTIPLRITHGLAPFLGNLFGLFVLGYFIMWFVVPAARSARQKLEMEGDPITVRSIRDRTAPRTEINGEVKSLFARVIYALGQLALILIKFCIGIFVFALTVAACILLVGLFGLIFTDPGEWSALTLFGEAVHARLPGIMCMVAILIPLLLLIYVLLCLIASRKPSGRATLIVFLCWLLSLIVTGTLVLNELRHMKWDGLNFFIEEIREEFRDEELDEARAWVQADTTAVVRTPSQPAATTDSVHRITIQGPQKQRVDIRMSNGNVDIDFNDAGYE